MVWGLFPADPLSGEEKYYIFSKGIYKVGRKGCDVIINKDKGVSRIHAEIVVDDMVFLNPFRNESSSVSSKVRIRDCSKYGTFITRNQGPKEKLQEFPNKETTLKVGDLISFGPGTANYRFCFVPLNFFSSCPEQAQLNQLLQEKITSIGACINYSWTPECTHVLTDESMPLTEDAIDAILAKKPFVLNNWLQFVAEKRICTELPSNSSFIPSLRLEEVSVKVADPSTRYNCLRGYAFLLESMQKYKFKDKMRLLLEVAGAKIVSVDGFSSTSQVFKDEENCKVVHVIPTGLSGQVESSRELSHLCSVNEMKLICAALSGHLDPSIIMSAPVLLESSCSTDETVVADSDLEIETATSSLRSAAISTVQETRHDTKEDPVNYAAAKSETGEVTCFKNRIDKTAERRDHVDATESGNSDIIYSQNLVVRHNKTPNEVYSAANSRFPNFKGFRKTKVESGNSFSNLIPYAKYPYKDSDHGSEEVVKSVKEEKKRKQMEAVAEDLFNNEKGKRRGAASSLRGLFVPS